MDDERLALPGLGDGGSASMNVLAQGKVTTTYGYVGYYSPGAVKVSGAGSAWNNSQSLTVGMASAGSTLTVESGGALTNTGAIVGSYSGASGAVTVTGEDSHWTNSQELRVGHQGTGEVNVLNQAKVTSEDGWLGAFDGASGTVTVRGAGSSWNVDDFLCVGDQGDGSLNIEQGAKVSLANGRIAYSSGGAGTVSIAGENSELISTSSLYVGYSGVGSISVSDHGTLTTTSATIGLETSSDGTVTVAGLGSQWNSSGSIFVGDNIYGGSGLLKLENGGAVSALSGVTITTASELAGSGTVYGAVTNYGILSPGNSPGLLTIHGNVNIKLDFELASSASYDRLMIDGTLNLGGVIAVRLIDGYQPSPGASFPLLSAGRLFANGYTFDFSNAQLAPGLSWDTSRFATGGVLSIAGVPEPSTAVLALLGLGAMISFTGRRRHWASLAGE